MKTEQQLKNEKLACLILLEKYIEEKDQEKAFILAMKIKELNSLIEKNSHENQKNR